MEAEEFVLEEVGAEQLHTAAYRIRLGASHDVNHSRFRCPFRPKHISKKASLVVAMDFLNMFEEVPTSSGLVVGLVAVRSRGPLPQNWFIVIPIRKTMNGPCGSTVPGPTATELVYCYSY